MTLREIVVDRRPNGGPINVPVKVNECDMEQYVKRFIEIADYSLQDGSGVASLFRGFHGGQWTLCVLQAVLAELRHPSIRLEIKGARESLLPFFEELLKRHQTADDTDFGYPHDPSRLPM